MVKLLKTEQNKDIEEVLGFGESYFKNLKQGDIVQLVRYGFARTDSVSENSITMIFAHE